MLLQQMVNALVFGSVLLLFTLGLSLAWGTLDALNLAHGAVFVFAGFVAYELTKAGTLSFAPTLIIAVISAGAVTVALELGSFRWIRTKFRTKRQAEMSMLVASVGAATILNAVISNTTNAASFGPRYGLFDITLYGFGPVGITNLQIIIVVTAVIVAVALDQGVRRSAYGRALRAIAYDPGTSGLLGTNVNLVAAVTMFIAGALAGLAGVLLAVNLGSVDVTVGHDYLLTAFAILIAGGVGNIRGAVVAAYGIALAQTAVVAYGPAEWRDGVSFLLIITVLVLRPQGLFARMRSVRA